MGRAGPDRYRRSCGLRRGAQVEPAFELGRGAAARRVAAEYLDPEGRGRALWLSEWRLDLGRLLAAIVEVHHDGHGIVWPSAARRSTCTW